MEKTILVQFGTFLRNSAHQHVVTAHKKILGIKDENNVVCTDKIEVANIFNNYFVNIASKLKEPVSYSDSEELNEFINSKVPPNDNFSIPDINDAFVYKFLLHLDTSKATGLDFIGPRLLKIASSSITSSIVYIVNASIIKGTCTVGTLHNEQYLTSLSNYNI